MQNHQDGTKKQWTRADFKKSQEKEKLWYGHALRGVETEVETSFQMSDFFQEYLPSFSTCTTSTFCHNNTKEKRVVS